MSEPLGEVARSSSSSLMGSCSCTKIIIIYAPKQNIVFVHAIAGIKGLEWKVSETILELAKTLNAREIISLEGVVSPLEDGLSRIFIKSNYPKAEKEFRKMGCRVMRAMFVW